MIDVRFSAEAFDKRGLGSKSAKELSRELSNVIQIKLHNVVEPAFQNIIAHLNELGHNLQQYYPAKPGDIHYRDFLDAVGDKYKFLVAVDIVVTVGTSHKTNQSGQSDKKTSTSRRQSC